MTTPRFRDLPPAAAVTVLDAFLGGDSPVEFTEKLAGQNFTVQVSPGGRIRYAIKSHGGRFGGGGYFPDLEDALEAYHPPVSSPVTYNFEVLKKHRRPDYIDYPLTAPVTAVEFSGAMSPATADDLNSSQRSVKFLTKDDIRKKVDGLIDDPAHLEVLGSLRDRLKLGGVVRKADMQAAETILMDLVDSGKVPSTLGSKRMEGLFGHSPGTGGFKVPSKKYTDLQVKQAGFYAIVRGHHQREAAARFPAVVADPSSDKMVSNVLDYVDYIASGGPGPGFKVFLTTGEARQLKAFADAYRSGDASAGLKLGRQFFDRVASKESWVSSSEVSEGLRKTSGIIERKGEWYTSHRLSESHVDLLRRYVVDVLRS